MPAYRLALALVSLRAQVNEKWPNRSKASDGWIGDAKHRARRSDHNLNGAGVVCALDITHDPAHGLDAGKLAEAIRRRNSTRRIATSLGASGASYARRPLSIPKPERSSAGICPIVAAATSSSARPTR